MSTRVSLKTHAQILGVYFTHDWRGATDSLDRHILVSGLESPFSPKSKATEPIELDGLRRPEVRAHVRFVLTVGYRVAGSTRSRPGSRQPACGALKARTPVHYAKAGGHIL